MGSVPAGLGATWSAYAETEANRHLPPSAKNLSALRSRLGRELGPTGDDPSRYEATDAKDRQILADAVAAGAAFIITRNIADFSLADLTGAGIAAVDPDLFMSIRFNADTHRHALELLIENMRNPPRSAADMHALLGKRHPRLVSRHAALFDTTPAAPTQPPPADIYRGARCVLCGRTLRNPASLHDGLGSDCKHKV
ncbi:DUF6011 domain-containing protein [Nocardioides sp. LHD-245]|uniref:DUF6011 domain-containing protein n=1 Tax=Nocardioides sp. LHD-245 TaxID=3051387 RepID=UPI0027E064C5|nr:DUF6011 domain-containing protein [Nocardioides sp. LHD-245]